MATTTTTTTTTFDLQSWLMEGFRRKIDYRSIPDHVIILTAVEWLEQGILTMDDMAELDGLITQRDSVYYIPHMDPAGKPLQDPGGPD